MIVRRGNRSIREDRINENVRAEVEKQAALLEYVAIMANVEIPTLNEEEGADHERI